MDASGGFWITHSIPNFPLHFEKQTYEYPETGTDNGQTAICVSFKTREEGPKVIQHLLTMQPNIFGSHVTPAVLKHVPEFTNLVAKKRSKNVTQVHQLHSALGTTFTTFSRSRKAVGDLWTRNILPAFNTSMAVETWRRGAGGPLETNCSLGFDVMNVELLNLQVNGKRLGEFKYTEDHSKWGVSMEPGTDVICISDINRMYSQAKRGGGAICLRNKLIHDAFAQAIVEIEPCPLPKPKVSCSCPACSDDLEKTFMKSWGMIMGMMKRML